MGIDCSLFSCAMLLITIFDRLSCKETNSQQNFPCQLPYSTQTTYHATLHFEEFPRFTVIGSCSCKIQSLEQMGIRCSATYPKNKQASKIQDSHTSIVTLCFPATNKQTREHKICFKQNLSQLLNKLLTYQEGPNVNRNKPIMDATLLWWLGNT